MRDMFSENVRYHIRDIVARAYIISLSYERTVEWQKGGAILTRALLLFVSLGPTPVDVRPPSISGRWTGADVQGKPLERQLHFVRAAE
jgi:hypothetical protein